MEYTFAHRSYVAMWISRIIFVGMKPIIIFLMEKSHIIKKKSNNMIFMTLNLNKIKVLNLKISKKNLKTVFIRYLKMNRNKKI